MRLLLSITNPTLLMEYRLLTLGVTTSHRQLVELMYSVFETISPNLTNNLINYRDVNLIVRCFLGAMAVEEVEELTRMMIGFYKRNLRLSESYEVCNYAMHGETLVVDVRTKEYTHASYFIS